MRFHVSGDVDRIDTGDEDNFSMVRLYLEKDVDEAQIERIAYRIASTLSLAKAHLQERFLTNMAYPVSKYFGDIMKKALAKAKEANGENYVKTAY